MQNKYVQLLFQDRQFRVRFFAGVILVIIFLIQGAIIQGQRKDLTVLRAKKELVDQIPALQVKLNPSEITEEQARAAAGKALREEDVLVFKGMAVMNNWYHAIINDDVFALDEVYGDYKVIRITDNSVELLHMETNKVRKLVLPELLN